MKKRLQDALKLEFPPVATLWMDEAPDEALAFADGKRGCLMSLFAAAAKGKIAALGKKNVGCPGGGVGMCYGNYYAENFPGGVDCFSRFLSNGNQGYPKGEAIAEQMQGHAPDTFIEEFLHGERYMKSPEIVVDFIDKVGIMDLGEKQTVFMPLPMAEERKLKPATVTIICNASQLSALIILCNYFRRGIENVAAPYVAGCQSIGAVTYSEMESLSPRGIIGLVDITARKTIKNSLGADKLTFSVPYPLFREMEENIAGSFLEKSPWLEIIPSSAF